MRLSQMSPADDLASRGYTLMPARLRRFRYHIARGQGHSSLPNLA